MAQLEDVKTEIAALKTEVHAALSELAATGAAGHAAILDEIVGDIKDTKGEFKSAIAAIPAPGKAPVM